MSETDENFRALVGAALVNPRFAPFVGIALDRGEIHKNDAFTTVAIAVAYNHDHDEQEGLVGVLERLDAWGEVERTGGLQFIAALMQGRPALTAMLAELQARLDRLPAIAKEPIVLAAAEILGAERMTYQPSLYCEGQDGSAAGIA